LLSLTEWAESNRVADRSWLVLGKGPTFSKLQPSHSKQFSLFTLNHVIREVPATVAHIIDFDVVEDCASAIDRNAEFLLMPLRPHVDCLPTNKTLDQFVAENALLQKLSREGRLVWYNCSSTKLPPRTGSPIIEVKFFSAEAAVNILAACGVKTIRSLGIDGGEQYSSSFDDLAGTTRLKNGHATFDGQFSGIAKTILKTGIFYAPLTIPAPVRVFVGTDAAQIAGLKVLEYSIKKHASISTEVVAIDNGGIPEPDEPKNRSRTGFSFARFRIPELCNFGGRAIYLDADMQVFSDIRELWTMPFNDSDILYSEQTTKEGRAPQYSVMVMNCENLQWDVREIVAGLDAGRFNYEDVMYHFWLVPPSKRRAGLPFEWNSLEHYEIGKTKLIHFTDMPTQPWVTNRNKFGLVWYADLREAVESGFIAKDFLYREVELGHVSPDLPSWIGLPNPDCHAQLIQTWVPPFRRFSAPGKQTASPPRVDEPADSNKSLAKTLARAVMSRFHR
jgi:hypothetical protein